MSKSKLLSRSEPGERGTPQHYLPTAERTYAPTRLITLACEVSPGEVSGMGQVQAYVFRRVHCTYSTYRRGHWLPGCDRSFGTRAEFWRWAVSLMRAKSILFLVTPHGMDDMTLLDVEGQLSNRTLRLWSTPARSVYRSDPDKERRRKFSGHFLANNPPDILYAMGPTGPVKCYGLRNYYPSCLSELADTFHVPPDPPTDSSIRSLTARWTAAGAARVTRAAMHGLCDWWRANDAGPWRDTTPALALSLFKRRFLSHRLLVHTDEEARELERAASFGPRQAVWFYGDIGPHPGFRRKGQPPPEKAPYPSLPGPCYRVDVRSQYPHLMRQHTFPAVLRGVTGRSNPDHLRDLLGLWGCIAEVTIRSYRGEFPSKAGGTNVYPVGRFTTTLAGPELLDALDREEVEAVGRVARYEMKPLFREYGGHLWAQRAVAREDHDGAGEMFLKLLANSFVGKMTRRPGKFVRDTRRAPRKEWGWTTVIDHETRETTHERGIAGHREVWDKDATTTPVCPAAFAYMTAYSRLQMVALRGLLDPGDVYAQHTDCLWVSEDGLAKLTAAGKIQPDQLGGLKPSEPITYQRFLTPSHRYADGEWTAGGIAEGFLVKRHCQFHATIRVNNNRGKDVRRKARVADHRITRNLSNIDRPYDIDEYGWMIPPLFGRDDPTVARPPDPIRPNGRQPAVGDGASLF